jgi:YcxB-like protein
VETPQRLHYSVTPTDQIKGLVVVFDDAPYGKLMVRNTRLSAGAVFALMAALAWFVAPVDPILAKIWAIGFLVGCVIFVVFAKPIARDTYRRRLTRLAKQQDVGSHGSHVATIRDDGLQEQFVGGTVLIPWDQLQGITETDGFYLIHTGRGGFFLIPKQPDPQATAAFIASVRERLPLVEV